MTELESFIEKCKAKHYSLDWIEFEQDLTSLMQSAEMPTRKKALKESMKHIGPGHSDTYAAGKLSGFIECYDWLAQHREQPTQEVSPLQKLKDMQSMDEKGIMDVIIKQSEPEQPEAKPQVGIESRPGLCNAIPPGSGLLKAIEKGAAGHEPQQPPQAKGVNQPVNEGWIKVEEILAKYWYETEYSMIDEACRGESRIRFRKWIDDNKPKPE